jgi:hypothetical protein
MAASGDVSRGTADAPNQLMDTRSKLGSWALSAALALGCSQTVQEKEEKLTPASLTVSAPERLVRARCMREMQCGKVGPDKTYSSGSDCLSQVERQWEVALEARQCDYGINEVRLRRCLSFVRVQDCRDRYSQETLDNQCRSDQICLERHWLSRVSWL